MMRDAGLKIMRKVRIINHTFSALDGKEGRITCIDESYVAPFGISFLDRPMECRRLWFSEDQLELVGGNDGQSEGHTPG